jgi:hypothetical protein
MQQVTLTDSTPPICFTIDAQRVVIITTENEIILKWIFVLKDGSERKADEKLR